MRTRTLLVGITTVIFTLGIALPASADSGVTPASITVLGGSLSITVPVGIVDLGSRANAVGGMTIGGSLGLVQVTDARSAAAGSGWIATVISTAFTPPTPPAGPAIPASAVSYTVGAITKVGTATYAADDPGNLTGVCPAVTATGITGDNSASWDPTISVSVPGGFAAGIYYATITHSVL